MVNGAVSDCWCILERPRHRSAEIVIWPHGIYPGSLLSNGGRDGGRVATVRKFICFLSNMLSWISRRVEAEVKLFETEIHTLWEIDTRVGRAMEEWIALRGPGCGLDCRKPSLRTRDSVII